MELARLFLNIGNADARRDIGDPYEMHSTLARAFAMDAQTAPARFLWRLEDVRPGRPPELLVQSDDGGRWDEFERANPGWSIRCETRAWNPSDTLVAGRVVSFRIRCNPTVTRAGKRLGLWAESEQRAWFERQAAKSGLADLQLLHVSSQRAVGRRRKGEGGVVVCAAQIEGLGRVQDVAALSAAVRQGIGHAKMMGLGLLSLAPGR